MRAGGLAAGPEALLAAGFHAAARSAACALDRPVAIIGVVAYRYLFEQLVRRELRQKYKGSALGVLWYLINPLVLMGAYYLMFGLIFKLDTIDDYPLFLMVGLVVWIFFSQSVLSAAPSLLEQGALVRKARFPRATIPGAVVSVQLVTFLVILALVAVVTIAFRGTLDVGDPAAAAHPRLPVRVHARLRAGREHPARVLPRRRADPLRRAAAVVLRLADLLSDRLDHAQRRLPPPARVGQPDRAVHHRDPRRHLRRRRAGRRVLAYVRAPRS